jgi:cystathionine beta-lyase
MSTRDPDLDDLDRALLRGRVSEKWNTYPKNVLPAWVAEMDFPLAEPIHDVLAHALSFGDLGYPIAPRDTGLPEVFAERMQSRFGWNVEPRRVEILTDVVQGMYVALEVFSEPGEGVVVQTPIYTPFLDSVSEMKRKLVENRLVPDSHGWQIDFDALARDIGPDTRIVLLCNPHNPSGRVFTREELGRLAALACEHDLVVVSDEIHGDLVFDGRPHIPFASLSPEVAERTITLTSATKAFNIPGLRCAVAHFGSPALQRRFNRVPRHIRGGIGLLGLYGTIAAWRDSQPWLDRVVPYLQANRDALSLAVSESLPEVVCHPAQATYLAWLDCSALGFEDSPAAHILARQQLAVSDGRIFGKGFEQFIRVNFATSRTILMEVLEKVEKALHAR